MREGLAVVVIAMFLARVCSGTSAAEQTPLTLKAALATVVTPLASDAQISGLAAAASARPGTTPSLQSGVSVAPDVGVPTKYSFTQQLNIDVGSSALRLARARSAQAAAAQVLASLSVSRRSAEQNVVSGFFAVAADQAQLASASQNVSLARRTLDATAQRRRVGTAPRVDEDRARAALRTSDADLAAATAALDADRAALRELLHAPTLSRVELPAVLDLPSPQSVRDRALLNSPLVATASAELRSAEAAELTAEGESGPGLSVGAGVGLTGDASSRTVGPVVSATLTLPVSTNATRAARGAAAARTYAANVALQQARQDAVIAALRLRTTATSIAARLVPLRDALESARHVAESTLGGYRLGAVSSADLIAAQTQFVTAGAALDAATLQASAAYASLLIEIGDIPS